MLSQYPMELSVEVLPITDEVIYSNDIRLLGGPNLCYPDTQWMSGEGDLIRENFSNKAVPSKKGKKTHRDNIHFQGDVFWVILIPYEEDELDANKVTSLGKPTIVDLRNPIRRTRCKKTHRDSLHYPRNIFRVVLMPDGQNATEGGSIRETITIRSKRNMLL